MRLIDADLLINELEKRVRTPRSTMEIIRDIIPLIKEQPTAYDKNKVIERLKDVYDYYYFNFNNDNGIKCVELADAIEIVETNGDYEG